MKLLHMFQNMSSKIMIEAENLTKTFRISLAWFSQKTLVALDNLSFKIPAGKAVAILGSNGSGKTTLLRILSTFLLPTSGEIKVAGHSILELNRVKPLIGMIPSQAGGFSGRLSGRLNLEFYAVLQHLPPATILTRLQVLLERVGLSNLDRQAGRNLFDRSKAAPLHCTRPFTQPHDSPFR